MCKVDYTPAIVRLRELAVLKREELKYTKGISDQIYVQEYADRLEWAARILENDMRRE